MRKPDQANEDLIQYQELLKRSDELELDIPPRNDVKLQKKGKVGKKRAKLRKLKKSQPEPPKHHHNYSIFKKREEKSAGKVAVKVEDEAPKRKLRSSAKEVEVPVVLTKSNYSIPKFTKSPTTFHDKVSIDNLYESMIELIRNSSADIDFGMLLGFLPKNIEYEKRKFQVENQEAERLLWNMQRATFSNDIDTFFRQISGRPIEGSSEVPLV